MGRKPISNALKVARGTDQPCRMKTEMDIPKLIDVQAPAYLSKDAKKVFLATAHQLMCNQMLTSLDLAMLEQYSISVARAIEAERILKKESPVVFVKDEDGNVLSQQVNVWFTIQKDSIKLANALATEFGLTPVSRMKIMSMMKQPEEAKDDFSDFDEV